MGQAWCHEVHAPVSEYESDTLLAAVHAAFRAAVGSALSGSMFVHSEAKQLIILDNRRWMHAAAQSTANGGRKMCTAFT